MLRIDNLTYRIAGRTILEGASVTIPDGHKVGLVGRNGTGKSTLLKLLTGELLPDGGTIELSARTRVGSVLQEMPEAKRSPLAFVLAADSERDALLTEAETATDPQRIADIHTRLADIGAESAEARAASILAGLGFDDAMQGRPLGDFSGGWRMRVALAATLFAAPELMLLDEPSNHLDLETRIWLESYLNNYRGTILLVSHDRSLLNGVAGSILHLAGGALTLYRGNYDTFERTRAERLRLHEAQAVKQAAARAHIQSFIDRFRYQANKARQAQSRIKALERMEEIGPVLREPETRFQFPNPEKLPSPLVTLDNVSVGYDGSPVLRHLNLTIGSDDRIALLGANGNGKSTFLKLLLGRLKPLSGEVVRASKVRIGYFEQEQADAFDLSVTAFAHMSREMRDAPEAKVRAHLGRFGFPQQRADVKIGALSGGEKARLLFATVTRDAPNILLLDEPTNHLDIEAREALVEALAEWEGAVLLVTHDPHLVELCADRLWLVRDGGCQPFDGDVSDYRRQLQQEKRAEKREARDDKSARKEQRGASGGLSRQNLAAERRAVRDAEARVDRLTKAREQAMRLLADPGLYERPGNDVARLQVKLAEIEAELATAEDAWLAAQETLEATAS